MSCLESLKSSFESDGWTGLCLHLQSLGVDTMDIVRALDKELGSEAASQIDYGGWDMVGWYITDDETCDRVYGRLTSGALVPS